MQHPVWAFSSKPPGTGKKFTVTTILWFSDERLSWNSGYTQTLHNSPVVQRLLCLIAGDTLNCPVLMALSQTEKCCSLFEKFLNGPAAKLVPGLCLCEVYCEVLGRFNKYVSNCVSTGDAVQAKTPFTCKHLSTLQISIITIVLIFSFKNKSTKISSNEEIQLWSVTSTFVWYLTILFLNFTD